MSVWEFYKKKYIKKNKLKNAKKWEGMNVIAFGDSIIAGQELIREETPYRDIVYPKLASYILGARKFENFAETGTGLFKGQHNLDTKTGWIHSFSGSIEHYKPEIRDADVIIISYGNNDWKQPNPDGTFHSLDEVKKTLKNNIRKLRYYNDGCIVIGVLETMAFRNNKSALKLVGPNGFSYEDMVNAYEEIYTSEGVAIFDIRKYGIGNNIDEYVDHRDHFTKDKHVEIADALSNFVKNGYR